MSRATYHGQHKAVNIISDAFQVITDNSTTVSNHSSQKLMNDGEYSVVTGYFTGVSMSPKRSVAGIGGASRSGTVTSCVLRLVIGVCLVIYY